MPTNPHGYYQINFNDPNLHIQDLNGNILQPAQQATQEGQFPFGPVEAWESDPYFSITKETMADPTKPVTPKEFFGFDSPVIYFSRSTVDKIQSTGISIKEHRGNRFGIELEIEGFNTPPGSSKMSASRYINPVELVKISPESDCWYFVKDNSLRNNGGELVSSVLPIEHVEKAVNTLFVEMLPQMSAYPRATHRCGTHIHMDVSDQTFDNILKFVLLYLLNEGFFYYISEDVSREDSNFCPPINSTQYALQLPLTFYRLRQAMLGQETYHSVFECLLDRWKKYTALNLLPVKQYGSIEFRHFPGTLSRKQVISWVNHINEFQVWTRHWTLKELVNEIIETPLKDALKFMFPTFSTMYTPEERSGIEGDLIERLFNLKSLLITGDPNFDYTKSEYYLECPLIKLHNPKIIRRLQKRNDTLVGVKQKYNKIAAREIKSSVDMTIKSNILGSFPSEVTLEAGADYKKKVGTYLMNV